ncbi:hypothetical protein [Eudoraea adriatica]|uniref:hypothetical protein n=1 Tax=Eudoraea adriatica TaxID=446681 RepID=UPI0003757D49|nr:hypothetical protein [Eudoraea adriatica]
MNKQDLAWQLSHSSSKWIYVITWDNLLKQLFTPFRVSVLKPVGSLNKGQIVWVDQVKVTMDLKTVFVIEGCAYFHFHFDILID